MYCFGLHLPTRFAPIPLSKPIPMSSRCTSFFPILECDTPLPGQPCSWGQPGQPPRNSRIRLTADLWRGYACFPRTKRHSWVLVTHVLLLKTSCFLYSCFILKPLSLLTKSLKPHRWNSKVLSCSLSTSIWVTGSLLQDDLTQGPGGQSL